MQAAIPSWLAVRLRDILLVALVVLAAALFGIVTRPIGFLSMFWPANAVLLGLMVRRQRLMNVWCWIVATIAFLAADLGTGDTLEPTAWLTAANIAGALAGSLIYLRVPEQHRRLEQPSSFLYLLGIAVAASAAAGLVGCWAAPLLIQRDPLSGFGFWFSSELVNYVVILPVVLAAPGRAAFGNWLRRGARPVDWFALAPAFTLLVSVIFADLIGGPGAIAVPAPALLWCALRYGVFEVAVLTLMLCAWQMVAIVDIPLFRVEGMDVVNATTSVRLGIALLALAPLTVASVSRARNELLARLDRAVSHDFLTSALNRAVLVQRAEAMLAAGRPMAALLLDLDHFKRVNDQYGHPAGDQALVGFADAARSVLRSGDLFGRIGGEEFAALLPDTDDIQARAVAERLRAAVEGLAIDIGAAEPLRITVSVGVATAPDRASLASLMAAADKALYCAKQAGRNLVAAAAAGEPDRAQSLPPARAA